MENLVIEGTKNRFDVAFDAQTGILNIQGSSYPENTLEFFQPIYEWLEEFIKECKESLVVHFKVLYMNTSTSKCLLVFLEKLDKYYENSGKVKIYWHYEEDDEDIKETGEELCEDLQMPYELVSYID